MPTEASFRFSIYLTLALTCAALGYAEFELLPEVAVFATLAIITLGILYFLESRVTFLSIPAANRLGMAIGAVYLMWAAYRIQREMDTSEYFHLGWHILVVALCGPLVMLAIVAKMARSDKHAGDYWTLHGVALAGIALAAAFGSTLFCFLLIGCYLIVAVWSFSLLYLGRASGAIPPIPGGRLPATKTIAVSIDPTGHRLDLIPALVWALLALVVAIPLYLLTPRSQSERADFGVGRFAVGYNADQAVNLNTTGQLEVLEDTAFEFTATHADGSPKTDVNPHQKWRGRTLRHYSSGRWDWSPMPETLPHITAANTPLRRGEPARFAVHVDRWSPPLLGPGQFAIRFEVPADVRGYFLASPVLWVADQPVPIASVTEDGYRCWLPIPDGQFVPPLRILRSVKDYIQIYRVTADPDASPPFRFVDWNYERELASIRTNPLPRIKEYADRLLERMVQKGELPRDYRNPRTDLPDWKYHEPIARAFTAHLAQSPDFRYSTALRRVNNDIDPIEEFLFELKEGHCERFATALVLLLRSQGIPAVYVTGFRGCEHVQGGRYVVKQSAAHAWVEALLPVSSQPPELLNDPLSRIYYWRTLDPTPEAVAEPEKERKWWQEANHWVKTNFRTYVTNYTPEQRQKAIRAVTTWLTQPRNLILAGLILMLVATVPAIVRRLRQAPRVSPPEPETTSWFQEMVAVLKQYGIVPRPNDTAYEFATAAAAALRQRGLDHVAHVPWAWAEAYYQRRFGHMILSDARLVELETALDQLRLALHQQGTHDGNRQTHESG
jgi:transglutaminase-like putative cysteine protease